MAKPTTLLACLALAILANSAIAQQPPSPPRGITIDDRVVQPEPRVSPAAVATPPAPLVSTPSPTTTGSTRRVAEDGSIVLTMSNGTQRISRPGVCGWKLVSPDGQTSAVSCVQVQQANPPLPDATTAQWLDAHNERLLDVARGLLGGDQPSIDNYLRNHEKADQSVYDRIRLRTSLLSDLTVAN